MTSFWLIQDDSVFQVQNNNPPITKPISFAVCRSHEQLNALQQPMFELQGTLEAEEDALGKVDEEHSFRQDKDKRLASLVLDEQQLKFLGYVIVSVSQLFETQFKPEDLFTTVQIRWLLAVFC